LVGVDTLRLDSSYSSLTWDRTWYITVLENPTTIPPDVPSVVIAHGIEAADVDVSWHFIPQSIYPINEYRVAMSYEGPLTTENWEDAILLGTYPRLHNQVGDKVTYTAADDGMQSGELAWFAVRGVDEAGQMSNIPSQNPHLISSPCYIEGNVYSDNGEGLPNVIIDYGCSSCLVTTDSEGHFIFGPVPNVNTYDLLTLADDTDFDGEPFDSYYNFTTRNVQYDPSGNNDIILLTRYGLAEGCAAYDHEFMYYFRIMTSTFFHSGSRPNYLLYKWETYPVTVYVPPFNSGGLDFQSLCSEAVGFWNDNMAEEYLVLVDTPEEAMVEFYFDNEGELYAGSTFLEQPANPDFILGDVIPEKVKIYIWDQLTNARNVKETAMHELGHSLGMLDHTLCTGEGFVMNANTGGVLANGPENAVHPDERRAVRAIRYLPQATDMSDFVWWH